MTIKKFAVFLVGFTFTLNLSATSLDDIKESYSGLFPDHCDLQTIFIKRRNGDKISLKGRLKNLDESTACYLIQLLHGLKNVTELDLSDNNLKYLPHFFLPNLKILNLSNNGFEEFPYEAMHVNPEKLTILDLSHNKISTLDRIHMPGLLKIDLSYNRFESYPKEALIPLKMGHTKTVVLMHTQNIELIDNYSPRVTPNKSSAYYLGSFTVEEESFNDLFRETEAEINIIPSDPENCVNAFGKTVRVIHKSEEKGEVG